MGEHDDEDEEYDEKAEQFETAYNFRFEVLPAVLRILPVYGSIPQGLARVRTLHRFVLALDIAETSGTSLSIWHAGTAWGPAAVHSP